MTATFSTDESFPCSAKRLFETLTDPEFQRVKAMDRGGVIEARCKRTEQPDGGCIVVLELVQKPRIGRSNEHSTLTMNWKADRTASWRHVEHAHEKRVRAEGHNAIVDDGDGTCRYHIQGEVEIKIPLIGKRLEKKVASEFKKARSHEHGYVLRHLKNL